MTLAYDAMGTGRTVVFLHGALSHRRVFGYQLLGLSRSLRVITIDLPGYGDSGWRPEVPWLAQAATGVRKVLDELGALQAVVVGWSLGGLVALAVSDLLPSVRVVLVGTSAKSMDDAGRHAILRQLTRDFPRYARSVTRLFVTPRVSPETEDWLYQMALSVPVEVTVSSLLGERPALPSLPAGTVVLHGTADQLVPLADRALGAAKEHILEGSGHAPFIDDKEDFNAVVETICLH